MNKIKMAFCLIAVVVLAGCWSEESTTISTAFGSTALITETTDPQIESSSTEILTSANNIEISLSVTLSDDYVGIDLVVTIDDVNHSNIISCGVIIVKEEVDSILDITHDTIDAVILENVPISDTVELSYTDIGSNEYLDIYSYRPYLIVSSTYGNVVVYSNHLLKVSLYELAQEKEDDVSKMIRATVEGKLVSQIDLTADFDDYSIASQSEAYVVEITTDDITVIITLTLIEGYFFTDDLVVYLNGLLIDGYTIDGNVLMYSLPDPNWTGYY